MSADGICCADILPGAPVKPEYADPDTHLLSWLKPENEGTDICRYVIRVLRVAQAEQIYTVASDASCMHKLTDLKPLVAYAVAIRAVNQEGEGDWSEEELFETPGACHTVIEFPSLDSICCVQTLPHS